MCGSLLNLLTLHLKRFIDTDTRNYRQTAGFHDALLILYQDISVVYSTSDRGGGKCVCPRLFVCLSVCLSVCMSVSKITQKRMHGFG